MNYSNKPLKVRHLYHILKFCVKGIDGLKDYIKSQEEWGETDPDDDFDPNEDNY